MFCLESGFEWYDLYNFICVVASHFVLCLLYFVLLCMSIRTCLVTGKKDSPENLFRFTVVEGSLVFDPDKSERKNSGRGGYVVREKEALGKLIFSEQKNCSFL